MTVMFRSYEGDTDNTALRTIIMEKFMDPKRRFYPSLGDWDYIRAFAGEAFDKNVTVCELEDGTTIGAIWPGHYRILYCFTAPGFANLEDEIFAWAEKRYCGPSLEDRSGQETYISGYPEDTIRAKILKERGYSLHTWYMYSGVIDLALPFPKPHFPEGYDVRPIQTADMPQKVLVMSGSAGLTAPSIEIYKRLMSSPTYKQQLDLVVVK